MTESRASIPPGPLVDTVWLAAHRRDVVVVDVRWYLDGRSGRAEFAAARIPGSVWVDLDTELAAPAGGGAGRHPLPDPAAFADAMGRLGIGDRTPVVAVDDTGGMTAGRLWWMLDALGHPVAVLDGGIGAWIAAGLPVERGPLIGGVPRARFAARPWPAERIADAEAVAAALDGSDVIVLDARAPERYRGDPNPIDQRLGHIAGARNAPWAANLDTTSGRFRSPSELRAHYRALGVGAGTDVIVSCGSGVSACADLLGLRAAGLGERARLYPASASGWAADPDRPMRTGAEP